MIKRDCVHYHCEHDMGASIDCCTLRGLGDCPCSSDCTDYANKDEIYSLGLEVFKKQKETKEHTNDVKIKVISSDKLIDAINKGSYEINLSAVMALGTVVLDTKHLETCEGCKHFGKWEDKVEYGYSSPCTRCKRRVEDHYER